MTAEDPRCSKGGMGNRSKGLKETNATCDDVVGRSRAMLMQNVKIAGDRDEERNVFVNIGKSGG